MHDVQDDARPSVRCQRYKRGIVIAGAFVDAFLAELLSGGILAAIVYVIVDRRLKRAERREAQAELVGDVLREVQRELEYAAEQGAVLLKHAPRDELPVPLFDVNGWTLLLQADVLTALEPDTLEALVRTYNRLRTANALYDLVYDMLAGRTAVLRHGLAALTREAVAGFEQHKKDQTDALVDRVKELLPQVGQARVLIARDLAVGELEPRRSVRSFLTRGAGDRAR